MSKIAFDARWIGPHGIGRFAKELNSRLYFSHHFSSRSNPAGILSAFQLSNWANKSGADSLYSPGYIPPVGKSPPFSFTIHDLNHIDTPHNSSTSKRLFYELIIRPAIHRARRIMTVSEFSKSRIIEWSNCDDKIIHVVGNGVSEIFKSNVPPMQIDSPYFFCCSNRKGHKNEKRLIEAFSDSKLRNEFKLVFTGENDASTLSAISRYGLTGKVIFTGRVSEELLAAWYKGAIATVFPSLYEGFGLPVIESMACGTPVITSNTTSMPEIGGTAAFYIDPMEVESISTAMLKVASDNDLRISMKAKGLVQAKNFSWDRTAQLVREGLSGIHHE